MLSVLSIFSMLSTGKAAAIPMPNNDILPATFGTGLDLSRQDPTTAAIDQLSRQLALENAVRFPILHRPWIGRRVPITRLSRESPNHRRRFVGSAKLHQQHRTWHPGVTLPTPPLLDDLTTHVVNNYLHLHHLQEDHMEPIRNNEHLEDDVD